MVGPIPLSLVFVQFPTVFPTQAVGWVLVQCLQRAGLLGVQQGRERLRSDPVLLRRRVTGGGYKLLVK